jgi:hypothetical protein
MKHAHVLPVNSHQLPAVNSNHGQLQLECMGSCSRSNSPCRMPRNVHQKEPAPSSHNMHSTWRQDACAACQCPPASTREGGSCAEVHIGSCKALVSRKPARAPGRHICACMAPARCTDRRAEATCAGILHTLHVLDQCPMQTAHAQRIPTCSRDSRKWRWLAHKEPDPKPGSKNRQGTALLSAGWWDALAPQLRAAALTQAQKHHHESGCVNCTQIL